MAVRRPSISAQQATLARAHLTRRGCLDDPWAEAMLRSPWREIAAVSRWSLAARRVSSRVLSYFAARTNFYDEAVRHALDDGATQVVILGAESSSRIRDRVENALRTTLRGLWCYPELRLA